MKIIKAIEMPEKENVHQVSVRPLHATEHVQTILITLKEGEFLKKHITPVDAFFYIIKGTGTVEIGDEQETVSDGTLIHSPANIPHRLANGGKSDFQFLVVKTPHQITPSKVL
jgi:quercetin dioxygenase-like cupin family protein